MKVHYFNILLIALPLNILVCSPQKNPSITQKIPTTRLLCECELYMPNYDNDPQMKKIMENFDRQTSQRFHEYDDRMQTTRQKCKDKCDKEIQKIILKDKLEKELNEKFLTLQTDIQNDAFPTCVCEKSLADKMEKGCLRCGSILGAAMPELGSIGGSLLSALYTWKPKALEAAIAAAKEAGAAAGEAAGHAAGAAELITRLKATFYIDKLGSEALDSVFTTQNYTDVSIINGSIYAEYSRLECRTLDMLFGKNPFCTFVNEEIVAISGSNGGSPEDIIETIVEEAVEGAKGVAETTKANVTLSKTTEFTTENIAAVNTTYAGYHTTIIASTVAILVIVLVMVIIYLILRYRRKKKMKKKLQYIKLLEE